MPRDALQEVITSFSPERLITFFRRRSTSFRQTREELSEFSRDQFRDVAKVGEIKFADGMDSKLIVVTAKAVKSLSERSGKKAQYDLGKKVLTTGFYDAGIFVFYDAQGYFRFSLIYPQYVGKRKSWSNFRRFTYFAAPDLANKTFIKQIGDGDFSTLDKVKESFSLAKVTNDFYNEFRGKFEDLCAAVQMDHGKPNTDEVKDFTLLFVIRVIFLGFIQKRGWIGDDEKFLTTFLEEYTKKGFGRNLFYRNWMEPLFFEALNTAPGTKVAYGVNEFSDIIEKALQMAPYLNGGLFERRKSVDDKGHLIGDVAIRDFFGFLFSYNFTIEENTLYDEELELNPEFLGIIFERLVNKENGAVYTPRTEVDFMCRMALVKWLEKNNTTKIMLKDLYELFFREGGPNGSDEHQRRGDFTAQQKKDLIDLLEGATVCDPAAGSGAFLVGMLHVIDEIEQELRGRVRDQSYKVDDFDRKERIISRSIYGAEVKSWAVWITQLRLWITLFIDAPDEMKRSLKPILPSLDLKVACGDSLVQRIGKISFPIPDNKKKYANISDNLKDKIRDLGKKKIAYFYNEDRNKWAIEKAERDLFSGILQEEIQAIDRRIHDLRTNKEIQMGFLGDEGAVDSTERRTDTVALENQKEALKLQLKQLIDENPFVWSITFPEIFFSEKRGFDVIIGNPPYIRQEAISDPLGKIKDAKEYKNALAEMIEADFPREFKKEKINAQSDLYAYFYIRSLRLLNEKGIHVFICSNSWLDVGYGVWIQKFLLNFAPVHFIFDNHSKRSFAAADVNTIISVIGAPVKKVAREHMVKFVAFKLPFEEVVFTENLLEIERARTVEANEKLRVYPIMDEDLFKSGLEVDGESAGIAVVGKYVGEKWGGKFLRAPDIFFTIIEKGKGKLIRLGHVADVRFGIKTGANEFFYLDEPTIKAWGIESEFLKPIIKSPRECQSVLVDPKGLSFRVFICNKSKAELRGTNALRYIEAGEKTEIEIRQGSDKGAKVRGYQNLESIKGRKQWWSIGEQCGNIFWGKEIRERLATFSSEDLMAADCRLYYATVESSIRLLCNSTVYYFLGEVLKRDLGGGGGPRSLMVYEVQDSFILDPNSMNGKFSSGFDSFFQREVKTIFEECGLRREAKIHEQEPNPLPDRKRLDDIVFDALGLTANERKEVYWSVCELVKNRLDKADSV